MLHCNLRQCSCSHYVSEEDTKLLEHSVSKLLTFLGVGPAPRSALLPLSPGLEKKWAAGSGAVTPPPLLVPEAAVVATPSAAVAAGGKMLKTWSASGCCCCTWALSACSPAARVVAAHGDQSRSHAPGADRSAGQAAAACC